MSILPEIIDVRALDKVLKSFFNDEDENFNMRANPITFGYKLEDQKLPQYLKYEHVGPIEELQDEPTGDVASEVWNFYGMLEKELT